MKFGQICEIWSKLWNLVNIVKFGQKCVVCTVCTMKSYLWVHRGYMWVQGGAIYQTLPLHWVPKVPFLAALAALYLPFVPESVSDRHFRILTQSVTFETWDPSEIWSGWWGEKKSWKKTSTFFNFFFQLFFNFF